jgi:hypothetical protein
VVDRDHERPHLRAPDPILESHTPGLHRQHEDVVLPLRESRRQGAGADHQAALRHLRLGKDRRLQPRRGVRSLADMADRVPARPASAKAPYVAVGADRPAGRLVGRCRREARRRLHETKNRAPKSSSAITSSSRAGSWTRTWARPHPGNGHIHPRCKDTIYQIQRFVWDEYSHNIDRDQKQKPKDKYDDFPAMLRYLANSEPSLLSFISCSRPREQDR